VSKNYNQNRKNLRQFLYSQTLQRASQYAMRLIAFKICRERKEPRNLD